MEKKVVFTFGRMNPFTKGHEELIKFVVSFAKSNGAEHRIYLSKSQGGSKNPLSYTQKLGFARQLFPQVNIVDDPAAVNAFAICRRLSDEGFAHVIFVVGDDRVDEFEKTIQKYILPKNDPKFDKTKNYAFKSFKVISSGKRKAGVSGTDMRKHAMSNNWASFQSGCPTTNPVIAKRLFNAVRTGLGKTLKENHLDVMSLPAITKKPKRAKVKPGRVASYDSWMSHFGHGSIDDHDSITKVAGGHPKVLPPEITIDVKNKKLALRKVVKPKDKAKEKNKHSTRVFTQHDWGNNRQVYKNPSREKFHTLMTKTWDGLARFLWIKGDWYFWNALEGNHSDVYINMGINGDHLRDTKNKKEGSMYGATLAKYNDFDDAYDMAHGFEPEHKIKEPKEGQLYVIHDMFDKPTMDWIRDRLKKDKKFIQTTKDYHVLGVHDHGHPEGWRKKIVRKKKGKNQLTFAQVQARVRRDMDMNLSEAKNTRLQSFVKINPTPEMFNEIIKLSLDGNDRFDRGAVRVMKIKGKWYVWPAMNATHDGVLSRIMEPGEYSDMHRIYRCSDQWRIANKIPAFTIHVEPNVENMLRWQSDVPQDPDDYYTRMKKDIAFRKMLGSWTIHFAWHKKLPPYNGGLTKTKKKMTYQDLRNRVTRDMDANLSEGVTKDTIKELMTKFLDYACEELNIDRKPTLGIKKKTTEGEQPSFASYSPGTEHIEVSIENRHPMDILRSLAHELVHHKQKLDGRLGKNIAQEGSTGSDIENEANAGAGIIMRKYGKQNPDTFNLSPLVESFLVQEGIHDKGIFKVVFLAGGPGSGKDYILKHTISGFGLRELNSDNALEHLMKKNHLSLKMPDDETAMRDFIRMRAKNISSKMEDLTLSGRLGVIVNGTANDYQKVEKIKRKYEELGYETMMIFVGTSNKVSRLRNVSRGSNGGRTVPEKIRYEKWSGSNKNKDAFQQLFGTSNFLYIDNNFDVNTATPEEKHKFDVETKVIYKKVESFINKPITNKTALDWILNTKKAQHISERNRSLGKLLNEVGGAGNEGTTQLVQRYKRDTPGQIIRFREMKDKKKVKEEGIRAPIGGDRIGSEIGQPKSPSFGDNVTLPFNPTPDPIARWMVKEETKRRFKEKYGELAEKKIRETASRLMKESLDDPYSASLGATPNSWNQETNDPKGGPQIDSEKQGLFGMKLRKKLNKKNEVLSKRKKQ